VIEPLDRPKSEDPSGLRIRRLTEWFDPAANFLSAAIVIIYLTGFLVVSWHLSRFGVPVLSLIQFDYLVAGLWVVLPPVCTVLVSLDRDTFEKHLESLGKKVHWAPKFLMSLAVALPSRIIVAGIFVAFLVDTLRWYKLILAFFLLGGTSIGSALFVSSLLVSTDEKRILVARKLAPSYGGLSLALYFLYVWFFALNVYPVIPFEWGGGRPIEVEFIEADKPLPDGIARDGATRHSVRYKLLAMTERSYVVLSPDKDQKSIQFNHDAVNGIIVLTDAN